MDWLPKLLDFLFVTGQVSACLCLAYGGYLSVRYFNLPSTPGKGAAFGAPRRRGQTELA
jgi:hypothetical protein